MSNIVLTIPQWSVGTTPVTLLTLSGNRQWINLDTILLDPIFGQLFSGNAGSNILGLSVASSSYSTPGSLFNLRDNFGVTYPLNLTIIPTPYSVSGGGTVFVGDSVTNLPITFTPASSSNATLVFPSSGSFLSTLSSTVTVTANRSIPLVFTDYNIAPLIPGGLRTSINASGTVTITGTPSFVRASSPYILYTRTSINQTVTTPFSFQVSPPRFQFSNLSGTVVSGSNADALLIYKASNDIRVRCIPAPTSITSSFIPPGMNVSLVGSNIILNGTPTVFFNTSYSTIVNALGTGVSTSLKFNLRMNPCLEVFLPSNPLTLFSNVEYTASSPIVSVQYTGHPISSNPIVFSLTNAPTTISYTTTGRIYGKLSSGTYSAIATFTGCNLNTTLPLTTFLTVPDGVSIQSLNSFQLKQNVPFTTQVSAVATSRSAITYSFIPPLDGPCGLVLDSSTGVITGTPRGVSINTSYSLIASTPFGTSSSKSISIVTSPDSVIVSTTTGLGIYISTNLVLLQGYHISTKDYPKSNLQFSSKTDSGDPIAGYFAVGMPPGVILTESGSIEGVPVTFGTFSPVITVKSINGVTTQVTLSIYILEDRLILLTPTITDFTIYITESQAFPLSGLLASGSSITDFSLENPPTGVSISNNQLVLSPRATSLGTFQFNIVATSSVGHLVRKSASITVNNQLFQTFASPSPGTIVYLPSAITRYPITTNPPGLLFHIVDPNPDIVLDNGSLKRITNTSLLNSLISVEFQNQGFSMPLRINTYSIYSVGFLGVTTRRWIQFVPIVPVEVIVNSGSPIACTIPILPSGLRWNPINNTITGSPTRLEINDTITVYATDGFIVKTFTFSYSVIAPQYLRSFSAPSGYTNYVKQRAFINAAVHATNNIAFLPEPLIASQTGPYPEDVTKDVICIPKR